jgi:transcription initiation factor TFIIE subunit alpha
MIKQGMNLTKEQRGEVKQGSKMDDSSAAAEPPDDKKIFIENDDKIKVSCMILYLHVLICYTWFCFLF